MWSLSSVAMCWLLACHCRMRTAPVIARSRAFAPLLAIGCQEAPFVAWRRGMGPVCSNTPQYSSCVCYVEQKAWVCPAPALQTPATRWLWTTRRAEPARPATRIRWWLPVLGQALSWQSLPPDPHYTPPGSSHPHSCNVHCCSGRHAVDVLLKSGPSGCCRLSSYKQSATMWRHTAVNT